MTTSDRRALLYGQGTAFLEHASFHLAAAGIRVIAVCSDDGLVEAVMAEKPVVVLLHWDTLRESALAACVRLRALAPSGHVPPIVGLGERLGGSLPPLAAFASGADHCIEGAQNPRILVPRVFSVLGERAS